MKIFCVRHWLKGTSWDAGKRPLLAVYRSLVRSVIEYGVEAYFFASPSLQRPLQKIQNDALRLCNGALVSTAVTCLHHACNVMPLNIKHKFLFLKFKADLLSFSDHPALSLTEDCWQERFPDSIGFCSFNIFTKTEVDHSVFAAAPVRIPNIPPWLIRKPVIDLTFLQFVCQTASAFVEPVSLRICTISMISLLKSILKDQKPLNELVAVYTQRIGSYDILLQ